MKKIGIFLILFFAFVIKVNADSMTLNCPTQAYVNENFTCTLNYNYSTKITGINGSYSLNGLSFVNYGVPNGWTLFSSSQSNASGFAIVNISGVSGSFSGGNIVLKSTSIGKKVFSIKIEVSDIDFEIADNRSVSRTINIINRPQVNNNNKVTQTSPSTSKNTTTTKKPATTTKPSTSTNSSQSNKSTNVDNNKNNNTNQNNNDSQVNDSSNVTEDNSEEDKKLENPEDLEAENKVEDPEKETSRKKENKQETCESALVKENKKNMILIIIIIILLLLLIITNIGRFKVLLKSGKKSKEITLSTENDNADVLHSLTETQPNNVYQPDDINQEENVGSVEEKVQQDQENIVVQQPIEQEQPSVQNVNSLEMPQLNTQTNLTSENIQENNKTDI